MSELQSRSKENRESMRTEGIELEAVFSSTHSGTLFLSWFLLRNKKDSNIISETPLDLEHHQFLMDCIDFDLITDKETLEYILTIDPESG